MKNDDRRTTRVELPAYVRDAEQLLKQALKGKSFRDLFYASMHYKKAKERYGRESQ